MSTVLKYPGAKWGIADWVIGFFSKHHSSPMDEFRAYGTNDIVLRRHDYDSKRICGKADRP